MPPPQERKTHNIIARDRDGVAWCMTCARWGVTEGAPCPGQDGIIRMMNMVEPDIRRAAKGAK